MADDALAYHRDDARDSPCDLYLYSSLAHDAPSGAPYLARLARLHFGVCLYAGGHLAIQLRRILSLV